MPLAAAALEPFRGLHNRRAIVDRRRLAERIEGVVGDRPPEAPTTRAAVLAVLKDAMAEGREEIRARLELGAGGSEVTRAHCLLVDQVIRALFDVVTTRICRAPNPTAA